MAPKTKTLKAAALPASKLTYKDMIKSAIVTLKERNGSSRQGLKKYVQSNYNISAANFDSLFNTALRKGVETGDFLQPKGPSGPVKLAKKGKIAPAEAKISKPTTKKAAPTKKTTVTKKATPTMKATVTKKPAAKKSAATTKAASKKAAPKTTKKPIAKTVTTKKAAPKKVTKAPVKKTAAKKAVTKKAAPKKAATKKTARK